MTAFQIVALLLVFSAVFSYVNHKLVGLPTTIGIMLFSLVFSLVVIGLGVMGLGVRPWAAALVERVDFDGTFLHGFLSFLLFAGALQVNLEDLAKEKWVIGILATASVALSTVLVGTLVWLAFSALGGHLDYTHCLLFGALISPTDPIAVLGILQHIGAPKSLETQIAGESLFNDGVGVVVFLVVLGVVTGGESQGFGAAAVLFLREAVGGALLGLAAGYGAYRALKSVDEYTVEVLITLALVAGTFALGEALHLSAPIAVVVAGVAVGNQGRRLAMSDKTREHLDTFWELVDEILNAVLFVLIGLEVLVVPLRGRWLLAGLLAVPIVLISRFLSVAVPKLALDRLCSFAPGALLVMTWGGLRGGISIALALSLPSALGDTRPLVIVMTYVVVVFSILVQGLTVGRLLSRASRPRAGEASR